MTASGNGDGDGEGDGDGDGALAVALAVVSPSTMRASCIMFKAMLASVTRASLTRASVSMTRNYTYAGKLALRTCVTY